MLIAELVVDSPSPKCSSLLLTVPKRTRPHWLIGAGRRLTRLRAAGLNREGEMVLFTKGAFKVICRPLLQVGDVMAVKSPVSIVGVGTNAVPFVGSER